MNKQEAARILLEKSIEEEKRKDIERIIEEEDQALVELNEELRDRGKYKDE